MLNASVRWGRAESIAAGVELARAGIGSLFPLCTYNIDFKGEYKLKKCFPVLF